MRYALSLTCAGYAVGRWPSLVLVPFCRLASLLSLFVVRCACLDLGLEGAATKLMKSRSSSDELQGMCARVNGLVAVR